MEEIDKTWCIMITAGFIGWEEMNRVPLLEFNKRRSIVFFPVFITQLGGP